MNSVIATTRFIPTRPQTLLTVFFVGIAYYLGAKLGISLSIPPNGISAFWPPNTVILAAILLSNHQRWWVFILAMVPANLYAAIDADVSIHRVIIYFIANCTEVLVAAFAITSFLKKQRIKFNHFNEVIVFLLAAVLISPAISASIASFTTIYDSEISYWSAWRFWFLCDALGHLTLTPVLILWFTYLSSELPLHRTVSLSRVTELIFFIFCLFTASFFSFGGESSYSHISPALLYSPIPVILWAIIRFGSLGVYSTLFVITIVATWNTVNGQGPFSSFSAAENIFSLQLFMLAVSVPMLLLSALLSERKQSEEALQKSEKHLRQSQLYGKIGTWEANLITNQQAWSEVVIEELGFPNIAEPKWEDFLATIHPNDRDHVVDATNQHINENKEFNVEYRIVDTQRKIRWMASAGKAEFDANGKAIKLLGTVQEITDQKIAEEKLQLSAKVFNETNEGIMITNAQGIIIEVNPAFCEISGFSRDEVVNRNPNILNSDRQSPEFYANMWKAIIKLGYWQGEIWNRKKDGALYAELLSISSIRNGEGKVLQYVGIFTDITHSKKQQESLEHMAHYDVLTQLPNRTLLENRFTQALAHSKQKQNTLAVCFLDLDDFKPINDLYGHKTGDQLLVEVANRLKTIIRDEDTVSRQGGDEFALLLGDIDSFPHCEQMLKRIINLLAQPYLIDDRPLIISASIGVTLYPTDDSDLDTLMRHADQAMYEAKIAGRNRYQLFNTEQDQRSIKKTIRLTEIQTALENNEMCLYYQPKVNMSTGEAFGAEALIRWTHPEKGLIPPLDFLPIIEGTELELIVGNWVINNALKQLDNWNMQGIDLELSVNISSCHLQSASFITDLDKSLALYPRVHSKNLQLEILESSALGDLHSVRTIIKTCIEALGVNIALDDFGTGYSSLTHLRNLPAKTIKIDQSFVKGLLDDPNDHVIIDGVIGLANSFNRNVIAEGVETTAHGLMLLVIGCNEAQGYGIARPMSVLDFQDWLTNYTPNQQWLNYANKHRSEKEKKIKLFRLTLAQWAKYFEKNIYAEPGDGAQWPILKRTKCHCGIWIKRARQEQLFEESWLIKLEDVHNAMHDIADDLFKKYHAGDITNARDGLKDINQAVDNLISLLGQPEQKNAVI